MPRTVFQLMGIYLSLYTSAAIASPVAIDFTPTRVVLERRDRPTDIRCPPGTTWVRRQCVPERTPWFWQEICTGPTVISAGCLPTEECKDREDKAGNKYIECVPFKMPSTEELWKEATERLAKLSLIGASERKSGADTSRTTEVGWDVKIPYNMGFSSVSAFVLSDDGTWVLNPANIIVGKVKGKEIVACQGDRSDSSRTRECYPSKPVNLNIGDTINFTWGMTAGQVASLQYAVFPLS